MRCGSPTPHGSGGWRRRGRASGTAGGIRSRVRCSRWCRPRSTPTRRATRSARPRTDSEYPNVTRRFQMASLTYVAIASLDGYVEDEQGKFDWAAPDEEVHAFVNDLERPVGTYLYGRRMYETMAYWETDDDRPS